MDLPHPGVRDFSPHFTFTHIRLPIVERFKHPEKAGFLYETLLRRKIPFVVEHAVEHLGRELVTVVGAAKDRQQMLTDTLLNLWPAARLDPSPGPLLFLSGGAITGGYLMSHENSVNEQIHLPEVLNLLVHLAFIGESVGLQVVAQPKRSRNGFAVNFRLTASASTVFRARELASTVAEGYRTLRFIGAPTGSFPVLAARASFIARYAFPSSPEDLSKIMYL